MSQGNDVWQAVTAERFGPLYARLWLRLEHLLGSATTMNIIALSTETLQDAYPFLSRLTWGPQGLELATLIQAIADEEVSACASGVRESLTGSICLGGNMLRQALALQLQTEIEQLRQAGDPTSAPPRWIPMRSLSPSLTETPAQALQVLQSLGQQVLQLYRQHRDTQHALEQAQCELDAWRQTASSVAIASAAAPSTPTELARSETFYHDLFELSPDGVIVTDTKGDILAGQCCGVPKFWNSIARPSSLGAVSHSSLCIRNNEMPFSNAFRSRTVSRGNAVNCGPIAAARLSSYFSSRLIEYEGKSCLLSVVRDVTERARLGTGNGRFCLLGKP